MTKLKDPTPAQYKLTDQEFDALLSNVGDDIIDGGLDHISEIVLNRLVKRGLMRTEPYYKGGGDLFYNTDAGTKALEYYGVAAKPIKQEQKPKIDSYGHQSWLDDKGRYHREDGPAFISKCGDKHWYKDGVKHREDGPAIEYANGIQTWYKDGKVHREDGPAHILSNGVGTYYLNGTNLIKEEWEKMTKQNPKTSGSKMVVDAVGVKRWYNANGQLHQDNGPAIEWNDGRLDWYKNGKLHREDGPAVTWIKGPNENNVMYYLEGTYLTKAEWEKKMNKTAAKTIQDQGITKSTTDSYTYWKNAKGLFHREDGPAIIWNNGRQDWYREGKIHRDYGPAIIYENGDTAWFKNSMLHRTDGPAYECVNGIKEYYLDGVKLSQTDWCQKVGRNTPAKPRVVTNKKGDKKYYNASNKLHREDGPAVEMADGTKMWYKNGRYYRENGPAIEWKNGTKDYYKNGKYIRTEYPTKTAKPKVDTSTFNRFMATKTPDIETWETNGWKAWYKRSIGHQLHREDGPAIEYKDGRKRWYLVGEELSEQEWIAAMKKKVEPKKVAETKPTITVDESEAYKKSVLEYEAKWKTMQDLKPAKPTFTDMIKSDATNAAYRIAANQLTKGVKATIIKTLRINGHPEDKLVMFSDLLNSKAGEALISMLIGFGLNYAPNKFSSDPRIMKLAGEFRIEGMAMVGNEAIGAAIEYMLPVIRDAISTIPTEEKVVVKEETIDDATIEQMMEEEEEYQNRSMVA